MIGSQYTDEVRRRLIGLFGPNPVMDCEEKWWTDDDILIKTAENIVPLYFLAYVFGRLLERCVREHEQNGL